MTNFIKSFVLSSLVALLSFSSVLYAVEVESLDQLNPLAEFRVKPLKLNSFEIDTEDIFIASRETPAEGFAVDFPDYSYVFFEVTEKSNQVPNVPLGVYMALGTDSSRPYISYLKPPTPFSSSKGYALLPALFEVVLFYDIEAASFVSVDSEFGNTYISLNALADGRADTPNFSGSLLSAYNLTVKDEAGNTFSPYSGGEWNRFNDVVINGESDPGGGGGGITSNIIKMFMDYIGDLFDGLKEFFLSMFENFLNLFRTDLTFEDFKLLFFSVYDSIAGAFEFFKSAFSSFDDFLRSLTTMTAEPSIDFGEVLLLPQKYTNKMYYLPVRIDFTLFESVVPLRAIRNLIRSITGGMTAYLIVVLLRSLFKEFSES